MARLIQRLQNYRCCGAVSGQIYAIDNRDTPVFQFASFDEKGKIVELVEFPQSWGIWEMRECISAFDEKSRGKWSKGG
jgi:hypothetical protein